MRALVMGEKTAVAWVHLVADQWNWLTGLVGNSESLIWLMFLVLTWMVAAIFFGISFVKFRLFGGEPPDDFMSYWVPAFIITSFIFGGILALSIFTR